MLNSGQEVICKLAVDWYKNSSEQVFQFEGPAGSGKTYLIYEILKRIGLHPSMYMPMAYTGQASIVMRARGFSTARSIHSSLYEVVEIPDYNNINTQFGIPRKKKEFKLRERIEPGIRLFFIDEGYMVPKYMVKDILKFGIKVIVCGDSHQLPPIGDEPGFLTGYGIHRLTELMRQSEHDPIVYLANRAMNGLPIHTGLYGNSVLVIEDKDLIPQMFGFADTVICGTNRTRETMNQYVRQIANINTDLPRFGERIICRNNNWNLQQDGIALANGLCGTVVSNPDPTCYNGKVFNVCFKPDLVNTVFYDVPINYEYFKAPYEQKIEMKDHAKWMMGEMFEYAYSITTHLAQGGEYQKGIYIEEFLRPQIQNQLNYTGITRFKQGMIYVKKTNKYIYIPNTENIFSKGVDLNG